EVPFLFENEAPFARLLAKANGPVLEVAFNAHFPVQKAPLVSHDLMDQLRVHECIRGAATPKEKRADPSERNENHTHLGEGHCRLNLVNFSLHWCSFLRAVFRLAVESFRIPV